MRIIEEGQAPKVAEQEQAEEQDINTPSKKKDKEYECRCTVCLTKFAFTIADDGVTLDNEGDFNVDCPKCDQPLSVGKVTGIVIQRQVGD